MKNVTPDNPRRAGLRINRILPLRDEVLPEHNSFVAQKAVRVTVLQSPNWIWNIPHPDLLTQAELK